MCWAAIERLTILLVREEEDRERKDVGELCKETVGSFRYKRSAAAK